MNDTAYVAVEQEMINSKRLAKLRADSGGCRNGSCPNAALAYLCPAARSVKRAVFLTIARQPLPSLLISPFSQCFLSVFSSTSLVLRFRLLCLDMSVEEVIDVYDTANWPNDPSEASYASTTLHTLLSDMFSTPQSRHASLAPPPTQQRDAFFYILPLLIVLSTFFFLLLLFLVCVIILRRRRGIMLRDNDGPVDMSREDLVEGEGGFEGVESRWLESANENERRMYLRAKRMVLLPLTSI